MRKLFNELVDKDDFAKEGRAQLLRYLEGVLKRDEFAVKNFADCPQDRQVSSKT